MLLSRSPIDPRFITSVTPLGGVNPQNGHVFPNFHAGMSAPSGTPVAAPGDGYLWRVLPNGNERRIEVVTALDSGNYPSSTGYYLDHVVAPGLAPFDATQRGSTPPRLVHAGESLGTAPAYGAVDLGTFDRSVHHFLQP